MKIKFQPLPILLALLSCSLILYSCSSGLKSYETLINQGILPISPGNAYLGTNLFLGSETSKSRILREFLRSRGAPGAIEIIEGRFKTTRLSLFYPRQFQVYMADLTSSKNTYEWIIRGPYNMDREDFRKLQAVEKTNYESAPFIVDGQIERFVKEIPTPVPTPIPTLQPTNKPTPPKKKVKRETKVALSETAPAIPTQGIAVIPSGPGLNSDQQAIRVSKGLTELTPEGDILHKVGNASETLETIAKWYTGDPAQAKTIAEFNAIPAGSELPKGAKLKIPKAIVKNEKALR